MRLAAGIGLITAGGLAVWLASRAPGESAPSERAREDRGRAAGSTMGPGERSDGGCGLASGASILIVGSDESRLRLDPSPIAAALSDGGGGGLATTPTIDERLTHRWKLAIEALEVRPDGATWLAARLVEWTATSGSGDVSERAGDMTPPFLIELDRRCVVRRLARRVDADLLGAKHQQGLIAELSFALPAGSERRYEADGFDATGRYRARYRFEEGALNGELTRYLQEWLARDGDDASLPRVKSASLDVSLRAPWFERLRRQRTLELRMLGQPIGVAEIEVEARASTPGSEAERVGAVPPPADPGWVWGLLLDRDLGRRPGATAEVAPELVALSLDDALATLEAMLASKATSPADRVLFMREWMRAHPELLGELVRRIRSGFLKDRDALRSTLFAALGSANTEASRAALMTLFTDADLPFGLRLDAAQALATSADPLPPGFLDRLIALAEGEAGPPGSLDRGAMQLTLGMLAGSRPGDRPADVAQAVETISGWLDDARTAPASAATVHALQAAGNAASDELASGLTDWLDDPDALLRAEAATALRNTAPELALGPLTTLYAGEPEASVRMAALGAIEEILRTAGAPPDAALVRAAIERLGQARGGEDVALVSLLGRAAQAGDGDARQALARELAAELAEPERDTDRLQLLGRATRPRWSTGDDPSRP